jgi:hypothetical protein
MLANQLRHLVQGGGQPERRASVPFLASRATLAPPSSSEDVRRSIIAPLSGPGSKRMTLVLEIRVSVSSVLSPSSKLM